MVNGRFANARFLRHLPHGRCRIALLHEQAPGDLQDFVTGFGGCHHTPFDRPVGLP
jgi:hypothetical protein